MSRQLSAREEHLLGFLLSDGRPGAEQVLAALSHARVHRSCGCGCDTIDLADARTAHPWERQDLFAEAVCDADGRTVVQLVNVDTMVPTRLEVYGHDGAKFPSLDALRLLPRTEGGTFGVTGDSAR